MYNLTYLGSEALAEALVRGLAKGLYSFARRNNKKGLKMVYSKNKELLSYAIKMGCKTAAEFAMFLRARESILAL